MIYHKSHNLRMTVLKLDVQGMDHHQGQLQQLLHKHARPNLKLPRYRQLDLSNTRCGLAAWLQKMTVMCCCQEVARRFALSRLYGKQVLTTPTRRD